MSELDLKKLTSAIASHIAGAYISGNDQQVERARELETALDEAGLNVDSRVDRIVLEQMRYTPRLRGTRGRAYDIPF